MAKKSQAKRGGARPATASTRKANVALVRDESNTGILPGTNVTATIVPTQRTPRAAVAPVRPAPASTPRPASAPRAGNMPPAATRAARARLTQANQTTTRRGIIRAENYGYVTRDLRLIALLAVVMFAIMVILHFILPS